MGNETLYNALRTESWNNALHSYGTGYIYKKRASFKRKKLKALTFLGIIVPVLVGGIVTTYDNISAQYLSLIFIVAGTLSLIQLILSVFSLVYNWEDSYSYYLESSNDNFSISSEYEKLFKNFSPDYELKLLKRLELDKSTVDIKYKIRSSNDNKYPLTQKENNEGMRYSLRYFKRQCKGCNIVPIDMKPTKCGVCGNF